MDVGKEVSNHYKSEFEFSKLSLYFAYIVFEFVVIEKILKTQFTFPPPSLLGVFIN